MAELHDLDWTPLTLKVYLEREIAGLRDATATNFALRDRAQDKFENDQRSKFAQVNEFRGALDDLGKNMATRRELETATDNIETTLEAFRKELGELRSRIDVGPPGLRRVQDVLTETQGRTSGVRATWGAVLAGATLLVAVLGVAVGAGLKLVGG